MNRLVYFEQIAGSARKFYLMTEDDGGSTFTANYGRIGTTGSVKTYPMSKWQHVYNTRIQHGYTDKTRDYLAGRTSLSPKTKPVDGIKYNITGMCKTVKRHRVYRIVATKNFETVDGRIVEKGEPGGWIESALNLSQDGRCWIDDDAVVLGNGGVTDNALVADEVMCEGILQDNAIARGKACIEDGAICRDNTLVCDNALVKENAIVTWGSDLGNVAVFAIYLMCAVEKSCQKNAAAVLLNVYGDGVVASVRKAALLDTELAGNQKLAQHLYRDCRDVMRTIVPKPEEM